MNWTKEIGDVINEQEEELHINFKVSTFLKKICKNVKKEKGQHWCVTLSVLLALSTVLEHSKW